MSWHKRKRNTAKQINYVFFKEKFSKELLNKIAIIRKYEGKNSEGNNVFITKFFRRKILKEINYIYLKGKFSKEFVKVLSH